MTIQLAVANSHGIAMASDRHVFRDGEARSTGRDTKLVRLRSHVPAAMMAAGPLAVFDTPVSRLALTLEEAITEASAARSPEALGEAVLAALARPLRSGPPNSGFEDADATVLGAAAEQVLDRALAVEPSAESIAALMAEIETARPCFDEASARRAVLDVWRANAARLSETLAKPGHAALLRNAPELCGEAVATALTRDRGHAVCHYLTVGLCCPATGVPVLVSLKLWKGVGRRLMFVSRFQQDFEALWRSNRTVFLAQGAGRTILEAMVDGVAEDHWRRIPEPGRDDIAGRMNARWDRAHDRVAVSSVAELGAIATGLVRGAEVIGYLTRQAEGTVTTIDGLMLSSRHVRYLQLDAGTSPDDAAFDSAEAEHLACERSHEVLTPVSPQFIR